MYRWIAPLFLTIATPAMAETVPTPNGLWLNPRRSVAVETGPCGDRLCGRVVWASTESVNDARDGGTAHLVGAMLLQDYRATGDGQWRGTVFVPDMGRSFTSIIDMVTPRSLRVRGCILGGLICKSQTWTRIATLPHD